LAILRQSYLRVAEDKDYRAEADKRGLPVGRALAGDDLHKLIVQSLSQVPERVAKEYMTFAGIKPGR
jgi:hypothetical protein